MSRRHTKRIRYEAAFTQAASILADGGEVIIRPESLEDFRTVANYWYHWRRVHYAVLSKSKDPTLAGRAATVLDSKIRLDTDAAGRVIIRIRPYITPLGVVVERAAVAGGAAVALSTGQGTSVATATPEASDHYSTHTEPWQVWFEQHSTKGLDSMLDALDVVPTSQRADPNVPSLDDLPPPNSPEGAAYKAKFKAYLVGSGQWAKPGGSI